MPSVNWSLIPKAITIDVYCFLSDRIPMRFFVLMTLISIAVQPAFFSERQLHAQLPDKQVTGRIRYNNTDFLGLPLGWDGKRIALLGPTGKLNFVPVKSRSELEIVSDEFLTYQSNDIAKMLQAEFAARYDISTSDQHVVVHPWGDRSVYLKPFEDLHQRFVTFFESRGVELQKPPIPLIGIVLRSRNDFERYLINEVNVRDSRIAGYYSHLTNRITTYDPSAQLRRKGDRWLYQAGPVIHEATHQSAFNTGLHNRFAPPPKWLAEGLAMLFESPGFHNEKRFADPADRVNRIRLGQLREKIKQGKMKGSLIKVIAYDRLFESDIELAYAISWGLSYYLYERDQQQYIDFLVKDSKRKNFAPYPPADRLENFALAFGNDVNQLEADLIRFFTEKKE